MNYFILRSQKNLISGYNKLVSATHEILNRNFDLICLSHEGSCDSLFSSCAKLNKNNFFSKELFISPLPHSKDTAFTNYLPYKDNIYILTMWETDLLHRLSVNELNDTGYKILVPSLWNYENFKKCNVRNIELLNLFVDDRYFYYKQKKDLSKFTFIAGAHLNDYCSANDRKDIDLVVDSFLKLFKNNNDVELIIKASGANKHLFKKILSSNIKVVYNYLSENEFSDFLASGDVFVSSSKSEGWGFFQIESLAVGRPIITIDYGGIKEFCNRNNSFFIDYEEELATGYFGRGGGCWAKLNQESLMNQMLYCYKNKDMIRNNWPFYSKSVLPKFGLYNYENRLLKVLSN